MLFYRKKSMTRPDRGMNMVIQVLVYYIKHTVDALKGSFISHKVVLTNLKQDCA